MDTIAEVGARVRSARKKQKMSQATLAEKVHISTSHISDFENGKSNISLDIFMRITEALGVSADSLSPIKIIIINAIHQNFRVKPVIKSAKINAPKISPIMAFPKLKYQISKIE